MPAFAIKISIGPRSARIRSAATLIASALRTSATTATARPLTSSTTSSRRFWRRATNPNRAPRDAISSATPFPIPEEAPVIMTVLSVQKVILELLSFVLCILFFVRKLVGPRKKPSTKYQVQSSTLNHHDNRHDYRSRSSLLLNEALQFHAHVLFQQRLIG